MTVCCSENCKMADYCAIHASNNLGTYPCNDYSRYGSGTITSDIVTVNYWCGENGNYKMFEPINEETAKAWNRRAEG